MAEVDRLSDEEFDARMDFYDRLGAQAPHRTVLEYFGESHHGPNHDHVVLGDITIYTDARVVFFQDDVKQQGDRTHFSYSILDVDQLPDDVQVPEGLSEDLGGLEKLMVAYAGTLMILGARVVVPDLSVVRD